MENPNSNAEQAKMVQLQEAMIREQYLDDFYRIELATRQGKNEATSAWIQAKLDSENSEVKPDGRQD